MADKTGVGPASSAPARSTLMPIPRAPASAAAAAAALPSSGEGREASQLSRRRSTQERLTDILDVGFSLPVPGQAGSLPVAGWQALRWVFLPGRCEHYFFFFFFFFRLSRLSSKANRHRR